MMALVAVALSVASCTKKDGQASATLVGGDGTGLDFEFVGPPDAQFEWGFKKFTGPGRFHVPNEQFGKLQPEKCFKVTGKTIPDDTRVCVPLPWKLADWSAFPPRGVFGVLSSSQSGARVTLMFVVPGAKRATLGGKDVALDVLGAGQGELDLGDAFVAARRAAPSTWSQPLPVELVVDGAVRTVEVPFDGRGVVQAFVSSPDPKLAGEGLLFLQQQPQKPVEYVRLSGETTLPRYVATETQTERKGKLPCFTRPVALFDRAVTVVDVTTGKTVASKTFKAEELRCTGVFAMNAQPSRYFGYEDHETVAKWLRSAVR
jgi:microcompartment protein CcmK/EutM